LLSTATCDALGMMSDFITTNRALRHNFSTHSLHYMCIASGSTIRI
jgi:hypothetical protein